MTMNSVSEARRFWRIVEESLVILYGVEHSSAHARVLRVQGRMTKAAIAQDVTYHAEPLHVAGDLAHTLAPVSDAMLKAYDEIISRVAGEADTQVTSEPSKKARGVVRFAKSSALSAMSR